MDSSDYLRARVRDFFARGAFAFVAGFAVTTFFTEAAAIAAGFGAGAAGVGATAIAGVADGTIAGSACVAAATGAGAAFGSGFRAENTSERTMSARIITPFAAKISPTNFRAGELQRGHASPR